MLLILKLNESVLVRLLLNLGFAFDNNSFGYCSKMRPLSISNMKQKVKRLINVIHKWI